MLILFAAILIYLAFFVSSPCLSLWTGKFQSVVEKTAVARLPDSEPGLYYQYRPTISFGFGQYIQQDSDFFTTGHYTCRFGKVIARSSSGKSISVDYDPSSGRLFWDGMQYQQNLAHP
jgi:hypothetical protein